MKQFLSICMIFVLTSCAKINYNDTPSPRKSCKQYQVSISDISRYIADEKKVPSTKMSDVSITPILNETDTVMYLVNYADGWELLSGDKRASRVLAKCDRGNITFRELQSNPASSDFMNDLSEGIFKLMGNNSEVVPSFFTDTWGKDFLDPPFVEDHRLVKVLVDSTATTSTIRRQNHLLVTKWGQGYPWNQYAPYCDYSMTNHCVTGCVMVAAAQVLYYLHEKIGVPSSIYGDVDCTSFIHSGFDYTTISPSDILLSDYSDSHWDDMPLTSQNTVGAEKVSALMVWLGYLYGAKYYSSSTSAYTNDGATIFPNYFSIACDVQSYPSPSDLASLGVNEICNRQMPLIMSVVNSSNGGHSIVVDGYLHERTTIVKTYNYYITFGSVVIPLGQEPDSTDIVTETNDAKYFAINWGWDGVCDSYYDGNPIWYNLFDNWVAGYTFNLNRSVISGFTEINED